MPDTSAVLDASAAVEFICGTPRGRTVLDALIGVDLHVPAHFDVEVLGAVVRTDRQRRLQAIEVVDAVHALAELPAARHPVTPLLLGAASRRANLWVAAGLYVELAHQLSCRLVTCDAGQAANYGRSILVT